MLLCDSEGLGAIPLFHGLTTEHLSCVQNSIRYITYPAGTDILTFGQCSNLVYIVLSGSVKIYIRRPESAEMILNILGCGEVLGELSAVDGLPHSASVVTLETSRLVRMEQDAFCCILHELPLVSLNLVQILTRRLRRITGKAEALATLNVQGRIAHQLLRFAEDYGQPDADGAIILPLRLTQSDLAGLVGASREKVNHVMTGWKRRRYISTAGNHHITVHDRTALSQCYQ